MIKNISKKIFILISIFILSINLQAVSLSGFFSDLRGDSYNLLIAPVVVTDKRLKKSRIAIKRGFKDQLNKLDRVISEKNLEADLIEPKRVAKRSKYEKMVSSELKKLNEDLLYEYSKLNDKEEKKEDSSDGLDDFSESDFEDVNTDTNDKNVLEEMAENTIFRIAGIYLDKNIKTIDKIKVTSWDYDGEFKMVTPHGVFLECFTPYTKGRDYFMDMRVFFIILNHTTNSLTIMTKELKNVEFNNNRNMIAGKTGHILTDILSKALGDAKL